MRKIPLYLYIDNIIKAFICIFILTLFSLLYYLQYFNKNLIWKTFGILTLIVLLSVIIVLSIKRIFGKAVNRIIFERKIKVKLYENLISIDVYNDECKFVKNVYHMPKINIKDNIITIEINTMENIRKIEQNFERLSTSLPNSLIVKKVYLDKYGNKVIIEFIDYNSKFRKKYNSIEQLKKECTERNILEVIIDDNNILNLRKFPHALIAGSTGSGKTYAAQFLLVQFILKKYKIIVLDVKRSYQAFDKFTIFVSNPQKIIEELERISNILDQRSMYMDDYLRNNPEAIASDVGLTPIVIIIEEYLALINSFDDAKQRKHFESLVIRIITMGRALSIHMICITQVALADSINSAIKSNLPCKIVLGNASETIYKTSFGLSDVPHMSINFAPGEGIISFECDKSIVRFPTLLFNVTEIPETFWEK